MPVVDEVADEPEFVGISVVVQDLQEAHQDIEATMDVAKDVGGHIGAPELEV